MVDDDQNDRDDELKSRVLTRALPCMMNPNSHDINDLLDECLDSDDDSDKELENCAMDIDNSQAPSQPLKKAKSLEHIPQAAITALSAAARASNTSLEKLGYESENDLKNDAEDDKMEDDMADEKDSGNSSKPEKTSADEDDEKYAEDHNLVKAKGSDAVLACGRCFTVVCVDCQRHTKYENQYRAMFVVEGRTTILPDKIIKYRKKELAPSGKRRPVNKKKVLEKRKAASSNSTITATTDKTTITQPVEEQGDFGDPALYDHYFQVICEECKAEIGVYDRDQIYHFYNVCA